MGASYCYKGTRPKTSEKNLESIGVRDGMGGQGQYRLFHYPSQIFGISKKLFNRGGKAKNFLAFFSLLEFLQRKKY